MKLCIILGAGASKPYGFPLGSDLKQRVIQYCLSRPYDCALEPHRPRTWEFLEKAARELDESPAQSIDEALQRFKDPLGDGYEIGEHARMAVTAVLFSNERKQPLDQGWYHEHLSRHINNRITYADPTGPLNIVTFNYDRTLEYYVPPILNRTVEQGVQIFKRGVKVQHVYGSLNPIPGFGTPGGAREIEYGKHLGNDAWTARETLKFIHDDPDSTTKSCRSTVQSADTLLILGFGFDHTNITRLGLHEPNDQLIISSGYKLDRDTKQRVRATCLSKRIHFGKDPADISTFLTDTKILEYPLRTKDDLWNQLGSPRWVSS